MNKQFTTSYNKFTARVYTYKKKNLLLHKITDKNRKMLSMEIIEILLKEFKKNWMNCIKSTQIISFL